MKKRFLLIPILTIAAALAVVAVPRLQESKDQLSSKQALNLVRTIASVEATIKIKRSSYGSIQDAIAFGQSYGDFKDIAISATDSSSATMKDYRISLVASADGQHFQISMRPILGCGVSFFTNESGVIYQGNALGCPMT
jgi:hypothetical protein